MIPFIGELQFEIQYKELVRGIMIKKSNTIKRNLILFVVSVAFSVIFLEMALRVVLPPPIQWKYPQEHYIYDPEIGHWLRPGQRAYTHDKTVHINSAGIRDGEYTEQAQNGVYRILALGDSQTFGNGLELSDTWPKQLERLLNDASIDVRYEVINSGIPGSDTWQHEIINQRMLSRYHPDAVVLAFYANDMVVSFKPKEKNSKPENTLKTKVIYMLKRSALLLSLRTSFQSIMQLFSPSQGYLQQQALLKGDSGPSFDKRWQQVDSSLSNMKNVCDREQIKFIIASLPRRDQVSGQLPSKGYQKRLQLITDRHQIPLVGMLGPLQETYNTHGQTLFIPWDGHNSKLANHIIAKKITESLLTSN